MWMRIDKNLKLCDNCLDFGLRTYVSTEDTANTETECHRLQAFRANLPEISVWEPSGEKL